MMQSSVSDGHEIGHIQDVAQSPSPAPRDIFRFALSVRLLHWWTVAAFGAALLTGLAMGSEMENGGLFHLHVAAVIAMGAGFVIALTFGNTMAVLGFVVDALVPEKSDVLFVTRIVTRPFHKTGVKWGKFNLGQKGLAWMMLASIVAIIITGINSWQSGGDASGPHSLAVLVALVLLGLHVFMAVINPVTRPALPGMVFGSVQRSWALHHHAKWVEQEDLRQLGATVRGSSPRRNRSQTR